jgi:uncharacterized protein
LKLEIGEGIVSGGREASWELVMAVKKSAGAAQGRVHRAFDEVSIGSVKPEGWLRRYLEKQRHGLTGHLEVAGFPYDTRLWACGVIKKQDGEPWWPYEQTAYFVDGLTRCGYLLGDPGLIAKAQSQFEYVLTHADPGGYLGPKNCMPRMQAGRWPHMIFFRGMIAYYMATGDGRVIPALKRHYLNRDCAYVGHRDVCNVEILAWLFEKTGDTRLRDQAIAAWEGYSRSGYSPYLTNEAMLSDKPVAEHGVTYCETAKLPAILYSITGDQKYLRTSLNAFNKLDNGQMLVDGVVSSSEKIRGNTPLDSHETCDIADYTWSAGHLLAITGNASWADRIERAVFNAATGAVRNDFKGLQYFSCPNQVIAADNSCHAKQSTGGQWMSYRPKPGTECCTGEVHRIMPNYVARMWMQAGPSDVVAALYGPSCLKAAIGADQTPVEIVQETEYPFGEQVDFSIRTPKAVEFTLHLRIPGWCKGAKLSVNGQPCKMAMKAGTFVAMKRKFSQNDRVTLTLPMELSLKNWSGGGAYIERGPLLFAMAIEENWQIDAKDRNSSPEFPAWNCYAASPWNYALDVTARTLACDVSLIRRSVGSDPWTLEAPPIELRVPARRVRGWKLRKATLIRFENHRLVEKPGCDPQWVGFPDEKRGHFVFTPPLPATEGLKARLSKKVETIRLVPYGVTHLRLTLFPLAE